MVIQQRRDRFAVSVADHFSLEELEILSKRFTRDIFSFRIRHRDHHPVYEFPVRRHLRTTGSSRRSATVSFPFTFLCSCVVARDAAWVPARSPRKNHRE
jgi:hypothetical protein